MTAPLPTPAPNGEPQAIPDPPAASEPAPEPPAAPSDPAPKPPKRSLEDSLASLDDDTRKFVLGEVQKARGEAKGLRERMKDADPAKIKAEITSAVAKAMGLEEDPPDPAALTDQLTAQTAAARTAQVELAVYRAAQALDGNASALLDSRSFMASLADLDPRDGDAVNNAVQAALTANPTLKTAPARRAPGPLATPGGSTPPNLDDQIAAAKKAGDVRLWMRLENQKLAAPSR